MLNPAIALCFDQCIDPLEMIKHIRVSASQWRFKSVGTVELVPEDEVKKLRASYLRHALWLEVKPEKCLVFRCSEHFAPDSKVTVKIDKVRHIPRSKRVWSNFLKY